MAVGKAALRDATRHDDAGRRPTLKLNEFSFSAVRRCAQSERGLSPSARQQPVPNDIIFFTFCGVKNLT